MNLHSPEPWSTPRSKLGWEAKSCLDYYTYPIVDANNRQVLSQIANPCDAERIVACINAMAGIPACDLPKVRALWDAREGAA